MYRKKKNNDDFEKIINKLDNVTGAILKDHSEFAFDNYPPKFKEVFEEFNKHIADNPGAVRSQDDADKVILSLFDKYGIEYRKIGEEDLAKDDDELVEISNMIDTLLNCRNKWLDIRDGKDKGGKLCETCYINSDALALLPDNSMYENPINKWDKAFLAGAEKKVTTKETYELANNQQLYYARVINMLKKRLAKLKDKKEEIEKEFVTYSIGDRFAGDCPSNAGNKYILASAGPNKLALINLEIGSRMFNSAKVSNTEKVTQTELDNITGDWKVKRIEK